ncbi:MAG: SRPBCC family protein [Rhizobiaceae bacterium]
MVWTFIRWGVSLIVVAAVVLTFTGKKTFHVEITIPAPPEAVWAVLTDAEGYAQWNPVFVNVEGEFKPGSTVRTTVKEPGKPDVVLSSEITKFVPAKELNQYGGIPGFITFDHLWRLEPVEGGTRAVLDEVDRGFYAWFWSSDWVEPSYREMSEALRDRVVALQGE